MPLTTADEITLEKTPRYFPTVEVPERIKNTYGKQSEKLKIIVIVCNPVDRFFSDYVHEFILNERRQIVSHMFYFKPNTNDLLVIGWYQNCSISTETFSHPLVPIISLNHLFKINLFFFPAAREHYRDILFVKLTPPRDTLSH